jgi:hypothetical protein
MRIMPTYERPLSQKGATSGAWYRLFQGLHLGTPPASEGAVTVGASPFSYRAPQGGFVILSGGTVSSVEFQRSSTTVTAMTSGIFPLSQGDLLIVTYSNPPNMLFVPT